MQGYKCFIGNDLKIVIKCFIEILFLFFNDFYCLCW